MSILNNNFDYVNGLCSGNREVFNAVFKLYFPRVKAFIYGFTKDGCVAEDLSQDVFVKLWVFREHLPEIKSLSGYIYRMARNAAINHIKRNVVQRIDISKIDVSDSDEYTTEQEQLYFSHEKELLIRLLVENMPEQRSRVFKMSRYQEMTNKEIALQLNLSEKTVKNHLNLALRELRQAVLSMVVFFA